MPATTRRPLDYTDSNGVTFRECSECHAHLSLDPENFQHRADTGWVDARCQDCRRRRDAENRRARRAGLGVRASRRGGARRFGVEIEFFGSARDLERAMRNLGLNCAHIGYTHRITAGQWKIVTDASVMGGFELVSPPLRGDEGIADVEKACAALATVGARVDRSCGLHVHHEVTDLSGADVKRLARGWSRSQGAINGLVSPSRRSSRWAGPFSRTELERIDGLADAADADGIRRFMSSAYIDRYRSLNLNGFPRYGTVEVRQHQGTISRDKIVAWIKFGQAVIQRAKDSDAATSFANAADLVAQLGGYGLAADQVAYLTRRAERFAPAAATV